RSLFQCHERGLLVGELRDDAIGKVVGQWRLDDGSSLLEAVVGDKWTRVSIVEVEHHSANDLTREGAESHIIPQEHYSPTRHLEWVGLELHGEVLHWDATLR